MSFKTPLHLLKIATSPRLNLRPMVEKDASRVYSYRNQAEVSTFQGWTPESIKEVEDFAQSMQMHSLCTPELWHQLVIELRPNQSQPSHVIGDIAYRIDSETQKQAELGIALDPEFQQQGYALEATRTLVDFLFNGFNLHRVHVVIDPRNHASRRLFERVGFRLEGVLKSASWFKGSWCDDLIMAILKAEWQAKKEQNQ